MNNVLSLLKKGIALAISLAFVFIVFTTIQSSQSLWMKLLVGFVGLFVLAIFWYFEYLKKIYQSLQFDLVSAKPLDSSLDLLKKRDIFNGMTASIALVEVLYALDQNQGQKALDLIDHYDAYFRSSLDGLLIKRHSIFKAACLLNNPQMMKEAYNDLAKLKETNFKKHKKMHLLYNWYQIEALNEHHNNKNSKQALSLLEKVDLTSFNPREKVHYYFELAQVYQALHQGKKADQTFDQIEKISPSSPFRKEVYASKSKTN